MAQITLSKGRGFKVEYKKFLKDIPDVYCKISFEVSAVAAHPFKTSVQKDCLASLWAEAGNFILFVEGQHEDGEEGPKGGLS